MPSTQPRIIFRFLIPLLVAFLFLIPLFGQDAAKVDAVKYFDANKRWYNTFTEHWFYFSDISDSDVRDSIAHWERIGAEIEDTPSEWSGDFATGGETHGDFLRWSSKNGFVLLKVNKCIGGPMQIIRGRAEPTSDGVVLVPERSLGTQSDHSNHKSHPTARINLLSVIWQGTTYLVPRDDLSDFSDYSAGLGSYNGDFLLTFENPFFAKMGAESQSLPSELSPVYPSGYEKFHKGPVRGAVVSIGTGNRRRNRDSDTYDELVTAIQVKLEGLTKIKLGLRLHPVGEEPGFTDRFELRSSKGNIATVDFVRPIPKKNCVVSANEDCAAPEHLTIRLGMVLSSNGK